MVFRGHRAMLSIVAVFGLVSGGIACAEETAHEPAVRALQLCRSAERLEDGERTARLHAGLRLAETAVAKDEADARAHFAVFCNLGKLVEQQGMGLGTMRAVRRLQHEIDRSLELAPNYVDALEAKSILLSRLPGWLGGDREEAAHLLAKAEALQAQQHAPVMQIVSRAPAAGTAVDARAQQGRRAGL